MEIDEILESLLDEHVPAQKRGDIKEEVLRKIEKWKREEYTTSQRLRKDRGDVVRGAFFLTCMEENVSIEGAKDLRRAYHNLYTTLGSSPRKPSDLIPTVSLGNLEEGERERAIKLATFLENQNYHIGKSPSGVAGACIYLVSEHIVQREIAEAVGTTVATIREHKKRIQKVAPKDLIIEKGNARGRPLSDGKRERLRDLLEERKEEGGLTYEEIAELVGCSLSTVGYWAKHWDLN